MSKKKETIHLRLDLPLLSAARAAADKKAGGNLSSYIRQLLLSQNMKTNPALQKELQEIRHELNKIGININQIAKNNNSGLYQDSDKRLLLEKQDTIMELFQTLLMRINNGSM